MRALAETSALRALRLGALAATLLASTTAVLSQTAPLSFLASPEVYKVMAENEQYRIISVTWKPGQRDAPHSHPAAGVYFLTDCALRFFAADGTSRDGQPRAGYAAVQAPIASHSVENIGPADCQLIMFEPR